MRRAIICWASNHVVSDEVRMLVFILLILFLVTFFLPPFSLQSFAFDAKTGQESDECDASKQTECESFAFRSNSSCKRK